MPIPLWAAHIEPDRRDGACEAAADVRANPDLPDRSRVARRSDRLALLFFLPRRLERLYRRGSRQARAELGANAAQALAHVGEAVVLLDDRDRVTYWNEGADPLIEGAKPARLLAGRPPA